MSARVRSTMRRLSIWISPEDIVQLIRIGLEHPDIRFEILYGASDNAASWWDNSRARQLGYRPTGKAEDHRAHAEAEQAKIGPDPVGDLFQGGTFCVGRVHQRCQARRSLALGAGVGQRQ